MVRAVLPIVVLALAIGPRLADACTCVPMSSCQRYASATAVFVADVVEVAALVTPGPKTTRMRVVRAYKGGSAAGDTVTVTLPRGSAAGCSLDVVPGKRVVIFGAGEKGVYSTSICHGSYSLEPDAALPDLPPPAGRVTGQIQRYKVGAPTGQERTPVAGALVWVVTPDGRIEARTDAEGRFTMTGVPLGPRMVRSVVAPGEGIEERIDLQSKDDCAEVYAYTSPTGRLIGAVLDHTGKPVTGADVILRPVSEPDAHGRSGETGPSGSFDIRRIDRGSYYVSVGGLGAPTNRYPYVVVFHLGVVDRHVAQPVTIGIDTVRLPAIRLQPPVALTPIVATIVCRDGTTPASASLSAERFPVVADLYGHKDFGPPVSRDGRATIRVVAGHRYLVRGEMTVKVPYEGGGFAISWRQTEPVEVDPAAPPPSLVLRAELEKCADPEGATVPAQR
jgi:hypothetical protein